MLILFIIIAAVFFALCYYYWPRSQSRPWAGNIEELTEGNTNWREVVATTNNLQLVTMSVPPGRELGAEVHPGNDQFFRVESGSAELIVGPRHYQLGPGWAAIVPSGSVHNLINRGHTPVKLYTIYGPPHHPPTRVNKYDDDF